MENVTPERQTTWIFFPFAESKQSSYYCDDPYVIEDIYHIT